MQRYIQGHGQHKARAAEQGFTPLTLAQYLKIAIDIELEDNPLPEIVPC